MTRPPELGGVPAGSGSNSGIRGMRILGNAVTRIYAEGGVLAFWTGNGLSVAKIFPESAIKFFTYESSVRWFFNAPSPTLDNIFLHVHRSVHSLSTGMASKTLVTSAASVGFYLAELAG